jgi:uncharacterized membrane protein YoaK (UPF0700 family)
VAGGDDRDAARWLGLGRVFTNLQTGNLVEIAFAIPGASGFSVTNNIISMVSFFVWALAGRPIDLSPRKRKEVNHNYLNSAPPILTSSRQQIRIGF